MCVALPGIVKRVAKDRRTAEVDFSGNVINAAAGLVEVNEGDHVLVHAGCIIEKVKASEAEELESLFKELEVI